MKIVALLSYFDEQPEMLVDLVESLARAGVAGIVAVDGAYAEYPDATGTTGIDQALAITGTAVENGMFATVHIPSEPWAGNEIEKRTFLFALGHQYVEPGEDWLWVVDGDEIVLIDDTIVERLHSTLSTTDAHVAKVGLHEKNAGHWMLRMLFRSQPSGIFVGPYHAKYITGDKRVLWASCHQGQEDPAVTVPMVHVLHRPLERLPERKVRRRQYAERAVLLGLDEAMI